MRCHANGGWRTNVAQGGRGEVVRLSAEEEQLALRTAQAMGTSMGGWSAAGAGRQVVRSGGERDPWMACPRSGHRRGRGNRDGPLPGGEVAQAV